jgi:hypothetical protein
LAIYRGGKYMANAKSTEARNSLDQIVKDARGTSTPICVRTPPTTSNASSTRFSEITEAYRALVA